MIRIIEMRAICDIYILREFCSNFINIFTCTTVVTAVLKFIKENMTSNPTATSVFFTKLSKYSGDITEDLNTWLREFNRCALIANKTGDVLKAQYLMMCLDGRAKAVLENYESEQTNPVGFNALVEKLKEVFDNTSSRESKMSMFEVRIQQVTESEEEYMLELVKMFRNANPDVERVTIDAAVKRKFLQGISPELKRNVFIFCNNPYGEDIKREDLLAASRKARDLLKTGSDENKSSICVASNEQSVATADILNTINNLSLQIDEKIQKQSDRIDSISHDVSRNMGRFQSRSYRDSRRPDYRGRSRGTRRNSEIVCFKCGQKNHFSRHCQARRSENPSGNL